MENSQQLVRNNSANTKNSIEFSFDENEEDYRSRDKNFLIQEGSTIINNNKEEGNMTKTQSEHYIDNQ